MLNQFLSIYLQLLTANFLFGQAYNIDLEMSCIRNGQDCAEREAPNASTSNAIISVFLVVVMPISFTIPLNGTTGHPKTITNSRQHTTAKRCSNVIEPEHAARSPTIGLNHFFRNQERKFRKFHFPYDFPSHFLGIK